MAHTQRRFRLGIVFLLGLCTLGLAAPAAAHGYLIRIYPADRAVLERAPSRLQAWFSEALEPRFSQFSLSNDRGDVIALTENGVATSNTSQLSARIPTTLPAGTYMVTMRVAFASDGHIFDERYFFWVGTASGDAGTGSSITRSADPLEIAWRVVTLPALEVLFGVYVLYAFVLLPGWGNARYRAGSLAPRVMVRLNALVWIALGVSFLGTVFAVLQQTAALFSSDVWTVLRQGSWQVVLNSTQIGDVLRFRLVALVLVAGIHITSLYVVDRMPTLVGILWLGNLAAATMPLASLSISSHAAGSDLWSLTSIGVDWLHVIATSAWIGGLVTLVVVMPAGVRPLSGDERRSALIAVIRRFSAVGVVALAVLTASGIYNSAIQLRQPSDIWSTGYGVTWVAKLILVVPLLLIALYHHILTANDWLTRRLSAVAARFKLRERLNSAELSLRVEAAVGVLVIAAAAFLAATPPPAPASASAAVPSQKISVRDLTVTVSIDPGAAGGNAYEVDVARGGTPLTGAEVWLRFNLPALDKRSAPLKLDDVGGGVYINAGPEIERAGDWQALVDIIEPGSSDVIRAAVPWNFPEVAPSLRTRQASLLNWLAVLLIVVVFVGWLGPLTVRGIRSLHLQTDLALIGLALGAVTIIAIIGGAFMLSYAAQQSDALRNPPPAVVNPTLADDASVARGRAIYEAKCASCHGPRGAGDGPEASKYSTISPLGYLLTNRRDESVVQTLSNGYRNMVAVPMRENERWDVINYLRSATFYR